MIYLPSLGDLVHNSEEWEVMLTDFVLGFIPEPEVGGTIEIDLAGFADDIAVAEIMALL